VHETPGPKCEINMTKSNSLEAFLERNRLSRETWEGGKCDWQVMEAIAADHESNKAKLLQSAEFFAKLIQTFDHVHSVRWRVKDTDHLLEKIVRKRSEGSEKYGTVSPDNYHQIVTDLVGVRALHLFKDDCFEIDNLLRATWQPIETPVAYVRLGDPQELTTRFTDKGFELKSHPAGYRSVHYVFASQPVQRRVIAEVQVRTIFEEGWSEIDHRVRYPNFSENALVEYFLTIFNRMAGSADEMGGFVRGLAATLRELESQVEGATRDKERTLVAMDKALGELESVKQQDRESKQSLATLKAELDKLRRTPSLDSLFASNVRRISLDGHSPLLSIAGGLASDASGSRVLQHLIQETAKAQLGAVDHATAAKTTDFGALLKRLDERKKQE
jgi:putative GTP pyrophosphokinase